MPPPPLPRVKGTSARRELRPSEIAALDACAAELERGGFRFSEGTLPINAGEMLLFYREEEGGKGATCMAFPPSKEELQELHDAAMDSPFGVGNQTVYDPSYRIAKEFKMDRFAINFEPLALGNLLTTIARERNATSPFRAELYKLNSYAVGGFFKSHVDTPKSKEHVGTLLVCLLTEFEGGEFVLRDGPVGEHAGQEDAGTSAQQVNEVKFDWSAAAKDGKASWLFFYSDCNHAVLPVTSGTRLTLSYDVFTTPSIPTTPTSTYAKHSLYEHLKRLVEDPSFLPEGGRIAIGLQHGYPMGTGTESDGESDGSDYDPYDSKEREKWHSKRYYRTLPKLLKGVDHEIYAIVKELGLPVEFRAVFELCEDLNDTSDYYPDDTYSAYRVSTDDDERDSLLMTSINFSGNVSVWGEENYSDANFMENADAVGEADMVWLKVPEAYIKTHAYAEMGNSASVGYIYSAVALVLKFPRKIPVKKSSGNKSSAKSSFDNESSDNESSDNGSSAEESSGSD